MEIASKSQQRTMRVFVSSTFRDMQHERDELVKRIFPRLRALCEQRMVTWGEVDLRWGITDEEAAEGRVLPICLSEIENCRPYFLGILGERYGYIPGQIQNELIEREPWLAEHRNHSVTELEIIHGVLRNPAMAGRSFFYFRHADFVKQFSSTENPADYLPENEPARAKQEALKARIRESGLLVREGYRTVEQFGEFVLRDLTEALDATFPANDVPDATERENRAHAAFVSIRAAFHTGREVILAKLDEHARGSGPPLVITSEPGMGKSALLAFWLQRLVVNPHNTPEASRAMTHVLVHFVGVSPESSDLASMLRRLMHQMEQHFGIREEIPKEPFQLRIAFVNWLHMAAKRGRLVLILDGLEGLDDNEGARDLLWLPKEMPPEVRLVLSTRAGRTLEACMERKWEQLGISPLVEEEKKKLIHDYLAHSRKTLRADRVDRIVASPATGNPTFLNALLEELRIFGSHEQLDAQLDHYLSANSLEGLYARLFERYEQDYERDRPGLVRDVFSLLCMARRGLSERELLEMLGAGNQPVPMAHWSPLYLAASSLLANRSGLLAIGDASLRQAVTSRYLPTEIQQDKLHLRIADYFSAREMEPRKAEEMPWHLQQAREWNRLTDFLGNPAGLKCLFDNHLGQDAVEYWRAIEKQGATQVTGVYHDVIEFPMNNPDHAERVSVLLLGLGKMNEAHELLVWLDRTARFGTKDKSRECDTKIYLAQVKAYARKEWFAAAKLFGEATALAMGIGDKYLEGRAHGEWGLVFLNCATPGDTSAFHTAEEEMQIALSCFEKAGAVEAQAIAWNNLGIAYEKQMKLDKAMESYQKAEQLARNAGAINTVGRALDHQGLLYFIKEQGQKSPELWERAQQIFRNTNDQHALAKSLLNVAWIAAVNGQPFYAMRLLAEAEPICGRLDDKDLLLKLAESGFLTTLQLNATHWEKCFHEYLSLFRRRRTLENALVTLTMGINFASKAGNEYAFNLINIELGKITFELKNPEIAKLISEETHYHDPYAEALATTEEGWKQKIAEARNAGPDKLIDCLKWRGFAMRGKGEQERAIEAFDQMAEVAREAGNTEVAFGSFYEKSIAANMAKDSERALGFLRQQEEYARELDNVGFLMQSIHKQNELGLDWRDPFSIAHDFVNGRPAIDRRVAGLIELGTKSLDKSRQRLCLEEALQLAEANHLTGPVETVKSLLAPTPLELIQIHELQAFTFRREGEYERSIQEFDRVAELARQCGDVKKVFKSFYYKSIAAKMAKDTERALGFLRQQEEYARELDNLQFLLESLLEQKNLRREQPIDVFAKALEFVRKRSDVKLRIAGLIELGENESFDAPDRRTSLEEALQLANANQLTGPAETAKSALARLAANRQALEAPLKSLQTYPSAQESKPTKIQIFPLIGIAMLIAITALWIYLHFTQ